MRVQATRDDIVAGLFYAQQIAIARGDSATIQFVSDNIGGSDFISVTENGADIGVGNYPLTLPKGFTLTDITLTYDKLGRTSATILELSDDGASVNIVISSSGYAK